MAMVVNPRVLFLDEPTSGLDSYTANEVMTAVKALALEGITICATIHSPSPYTFDLFDRLLVLVRGDTVYFGHNGSPMLSYFRGLSVKPPSTGLMGGSSLNNADFLTDLVVGADREGRAHEYADAYVNHPLRREMQGIIDSNAKVRSSCLMSQT
jgi:ATP-binding cassette, subfamily G (WHITE), member 2